MVPKTFLVPFLKNKKRTKNAKSIQQRQTFRLLRKTDKLAWRRKVEPQEKKNNKQYSEMLVTSQVFADCLHNYEQ